MGSRISLWFDAITNKWAWRWFVLVGLNYPVFIFIVRLFYPDRSSAEEGINRWSWRWLTTFPSNVFAPSDEDWGVNWAFVIFAIVLCAEVYSLRKWLLPF